MWPLEQLSFQRALDKVAQAGHENVNSDLWSNIKCRAAGKTTLKLPGGPYRKEPKELKQNLTDWEGTYFLEEYELSQAKELRGWAG